MRPFLPQKTLVFLACVATLVVSGCASFSDKDQPKLEGQRLDVTLQPTLLQPNPAALLEAFALPQPTAMANWAQPGANASHTPGHISLGQKVVRAWSYSLGGGVGRGSALLNPPVVHSGRVFAVNTRGEVVALNAANGKEIWSVELPLATQSARDITGGIAVTGNLLFVTTGAGQVFALTATSGKKVWDVNLNVPLRAAPTVAGETVFVTSHDNRTFALSALNGGLLWTHSGIEENLSLLAAGAPAADNGAVAVPYSSGEIYVLRASDGRYIWHDTLSSPFSGQDPEMTLATIAAPPVIADGLVYVVGMNGGLTAYGLVNGQRFWRSDITTSQLPIVAGAHIFALTEKGELVAMNRRDGAIRWVVDAGKGLPTTDEKRLWVGPVLAGGRLIVASSDGYAVSLNPENGKQIAATRIDDSITLPPIVADGTLYFLTDSGRLIAFRPAGT